MAMDELSGPGFVAVARALSGVAAAHGLLVPSFRCPPRSPGVDRALTRWPSGARVSIRRAGVPTSAAVEAMVEGVVVANGLAGAAAALRPRLRSAAWASLDRAEPAGSGGRAEPAGSGGRAEPAGSGGRAEPAGSGGRAEPAVVVRASADAA